MARGSRGRERVRVRARSERTGGDEREETDGVRGVGDARVGSGDGDAAVGGARGADASGTRRVRARDGGVGGRECGGVAFTRASFGGGDGADVFTLERRRRGPERGRRRLVDVRRVVGRRHRRHRTLGRERETLARARRPVKHGRNRRDPTSDAARLDRCVAPRRSREDSRGEDVRRRRRRRRARRRHVAHVRRRRTRGVSRQRHLFTSDAHRRRVSNRNRGRGGAPVVWSRARRDAGGDSRRHRVGVRPERRVSVAHARRAVRRLARRRHAPERGDGGATQTRRLVRAERVRGGDRGGENVRGERATFDDHRAERDRRVRRMEQHSLARQRRSRRLVRRRRRDGGENHRRRVRRRRIRRARFPRHLRTVTSRWISSDERRRHRSFARRRRWHASRRRSTKRQG